MSHTIREMQVKYITNETGEKTAVILPIKEFEKLLEDLEDLVVIAERRDEPALSHKEVIAKLKRDGLLSD